MSNAKAMFNPPTGTSFLPASTKAAAAEGNPIEKAKLAKDGTSAFDDVYKFAAAIRAGDCLFHSIAIGKAFEDEACHLDMYDPSLKERVRKLRALAVRKWSVDAVDGVVKTVEGGGDVLGEEARAQEGPRVADGLPALPAHGRAEAKSGARQGAAREDVR